MAAATVYRFDLHPYAQTRPPWVKFVRAEKSSALIIRGNLWQECIRCGDWIAPSLQNPSYLNWMEYLSSQERRRGLVKHVSSSLYHFGGPFHLTFDIFINQQKAWWTELWERRGREREGWEKEIKSESSGHPGGEQLSLRLLQCVSAGERILLFPRGLPLHRWPFICMVQTKALCITDEAVTSGSACRRSNE